ncbi:hypothetical protein BC830DRAFT_504675 [Chytriomyces sp. MP71]|nr:hypothetical protein BC830DRAFT_504675 [Chytriomyces sp. MP71]
MNSRRERHRACGRGCNLRRFDGAFFRNYCCFFPAFFLNQSSLLVSETLSSVVAPSNNERRSARTSVDAFSLIAFSIACFASLRSLSSCSILRVSSSRRSIRTTDNPQCGHHPKPHRNNNRGTTSAYLSKPSYQSQRNSHQESCQHSLPSAYPHQE